MLALSIGAFINARLYNQRLIKRSPFSSAPFWTRPFHRRPFNGALIIVNRQVAVPEWAQSVQLILLCMYECMYACMYICV